MAMLSNKPTVKSYIDIQIQFTTLNKYINNTAKN